MRQNKAWKMLLNLCGSLLFSWIVVIENSSRSVGLFMRGFLHHFIILRCCYVVSNKLQGKVVGVQSIVACPVLSVIGLCNWHFCKSACHLNVIIFERFAGDPFNQTKETWFYFSKIICPNSIHCKICDTSILHPWCVISFKRVARNAQHFGPKQLTLLSS
jgi:hypothetical protein